ncbi:MAG: multiprotein bridging factor aMBF1 [Candidatus Bathyarchaeia archaeon]
MRCEVCGHKIYGKPLKVMIEGAKLTVCTDCSKHGTTVWEEPDKPKVATKLKGPKAPLTVKVKKPLEAAPADATVELVEDYDVRIRQARENLKLSHEDLGKKLNEKVSLLRKIETKKMAPDNLLATKLERILKIKLMVTAPEEKVKIPPKMVKTPRELTLGDLIQLNKKCDNKEDASERKQS